MWEATKALRAIIAIVLDGVQRIDHTLQGVTGLATYGGVGVDVLKQGTDLRAGDCELTIDIV
mgnify:CR=1 FL=1|jgi:hypothetical protein|tara:strand:- start:375 stop:560 length:186 start_codon:yes stop_codon:yes gene_type:complete